jgi:hypothetical protein
MLIGSPEIHEGIVTDTGTHGMPMNLVQEWRQFTWRDCLVIGVRHNAPESFSLEDDANLCRHIYGSAVADEWLVSPKANGIHRLRLQRGFPGNDAHRRNLPRLPDNDSDDDGG